MADNFNILVNKLNEFKRKYYLYQLTKGLVLTIAIMLLVYTALSVTEYLVFLSSETRTFLFYGFLIFMGLLLIQFIVFPFFKLVRVLKPADYKNLTEKIQNYFAEIEDKLLNIIELYDMSNKSEGNAIILASIDQKIDELKIFDFKEAVKFNRLKLLTIYFFISLLVSASIVVINKNVFTESTHRLVHFKQTFTKPAPFSFKLDNNELKAKKGDAFTVIVKTEGEEIPQVVYINIEENKYLMENTGVGEFRYQIASVINPIHFHFTDLNYNSESYYLELLPKPGIISFVTESKPPLYTGLEKQVLKNVGDLKVPHGTNIYWKFTGIDVDSLYMVVNDSVRLMASGSENIFEAEKTFKKSSNYNVFIKNRITDTELALSYQIEVIPDLYPEIQVTQVNDSLNLTRFFFKGAIGDDYGFSNLKFHYNIENSDSSINIPFVKSLKDQDFYFSFDFKELDFEGGNISYYFSVTDNDRISGFKTTTSDNFIFTVPDKEELLANEQNRFNAIQNQLEESRELANEIKKDLKNLQVKSMDSNLSEWEKSQMVNDIINKQNKLEQLYDQIKQENENLNNYMNSFKEQNQEIVEKQMQIEELLEEVFTDELKELMEEFQKLAEEFDGKKLNELAEKMDLGFDDLQKQLDRNLEMLKMMKVEQKYQEVIDKLNEMAEEHEEIADNVDENKDFDSANEGMDESKEGLDDIKKEIEDALQLNEDLKKPMHLDDFEEDIEDTKESIDQSKEQLDKKRRKKASESIKNGAQKMKNLADSMQNMLDNNKQEKNLENIQNLKQILSNLIYLSFGQEDILVGLSNISSKDPNLVEWNQKQNRLLDQNKIIKDSLYALALRTPHITSMVNNELLIIESHLYKAKQQMEEALFPNARLSQQFVVTSANNLALMLNESLETLEMMMPSGEGGDNNCQKPGQGKPGLGQLKETAQSIEDQLKKMIEQMKSGQGQKMSQQLGQSLMQHEMMQQMLRDLMNNGTVGSDAAKKLQSIDRMLEQNRKDLINRKIDATTLSRQNLITTRLLEAEKAEQERDFEDKRESESADEFYSNPIKFFEYKEKDNFTLEYLNRNSHKLENFYINKYKQYLNNIEKGGREDTQNN